MGLLDFFSGNSGNGSGGFGLLDDPRQVGMMNMALGLLSQAGPSTTPTSLGQALGRAGMLGVQGMQQAQNRQLENRMSDMKMKYLQGQIDEQQSTLDEKKKISDFYGNLGRFSSSPESQALATGAAQGDVGPTVTNAERIQSMSPGRFDATAMYQAMLQSGSPTLAQAGLQGLVKERPKVKDWQKVEVDGQVLYAPYFEDGTVGNPVPYQVAEKLHFANTGGETVALNPFTGKKQASVRNTQSPESVASNAVAWANYNLSKQRMAQEQASQNQPQFNAEMGGFVTKPTANAPQGGFIPLAGYTKPEKPMTEAQAKDNLFGSRMQQANAALVDLEKKGALSPGRIKAMAEGTGRLMGLGFEGLQSSLSDTAGTLTNWTQSEAQQKVEQAQRDFLNAVLRKESGAAISPQEFSNAEKQYFPQAGDSKAVIAQKRQNRELAIQAVQAGVPAGQRTKVPTSGGNSGLPSGWTVTER